MYALRGEQDHVCGYGTLINLELRLILGLVLFLGLVLLLLIPVAVFRFQASCFLGS